MGGYVLTCSATESLEYSTVPIRSFNLVVVVRNYDNARGVSVFDLLKSRVGSCRLGSNVVHE